MMNQAGFEGLFEGSERFTLKRIQIANWGTFDGIHDIEVSEKGHLFVGGSGSGKSTILDAMSVLTSPRASNFNAAARQGERRSDRSFVSYMRGAWSSEQDGEGRAASRYLRTGPTWSGIALTYTGHFKDDITLLFIGFLTGKSREESQVRKHYFVVTEPFDLARLRDFGTGPAGFDLRLVGKRFPTAKGFKTFGAYSECFCEYFQIGSTKVLDLLHKAQSAKNLGDINRFFRDFMLAEPQAFGLAESLAVNFSRLRDAYLAVKTAREQEEVLSEAREAWNLAREAEKRIRENDALIAELPAWRLTQTRQYLEGILPGLRTRAKEAGERFDLAQKEEEALRAQLGDLERERYESGGAGIERLEKEKAEREREIGAAARRLARLSGAFEALGEKKPRSLTQWQDLARDLRNRLEKAEKEEASLREQVLSVGIGVDQDNRKLVELTREIETMRKHRSNIPAGLLEVRDRILEALGLTPEDLPFAGELLEIRESEARWQGALERVLSNFASSLLVREKHYADLARHLDRTHLGIRLVYFRVKPPAGPLPEVSPDALPAKFQVKAGVWAPWLRSELARRFNYACVESTAQFAAHRQAVTLAGQVKHNETRHEKDDRHRVDDRRYWKTGFSNESKIAEFEKEAASLKEAMARKIEEGKKLDAALRASDRIREACRRLLETDWNDIDDAAPQARLAQIAQELRTLREGNDRLRELSERIAETGVLLKAAREKTRMSLEERALATREEERRAQALEETLSKLSGLTVNTSLHPAIESLRASLGNRLRQPEALDDAEKRLLRILGERNTQEKDQQNEAENRMIARFQAFKSSWPDQAADLDAAVASAPEFFEKLDVLERDRLPEFEKRFRELLESSTRKDLVSLFRKIDDERRDIKSRMREVNESLADAVFNRSAEGDTHLIIDVKDLRLPEFEGFMREQNAILGTDTAALGQKEAEAYYLRLEALVKKLDPKEDEFRTWRSRVLDPREQMAFQGREVGSAGETLDVYDSGAGKSGGQRQKLTMTCLVAALRYQLGGKKGDLPSFAPIVMDEAFDKADSEFTDLSMRIIEDFGFQPIIATPEKGLYTLEPYVESCAYVRCENRRRSVVVPFRLERLKEGAQKAREDRRGSGDLSDGGSTS